MPRYHINKRTGNPGICKAKRKCPLGADLEAEHYDSKEEARAGYERKIQEKLAEQERVAREEPLGLIPERHRDTSRSDGFYNHTTEVDPEAIDHLATYAYYRDVEDGERVFMMKAYEALKKTKVGSSYNGWGSDPKYLLPLKEFQELPYTPPPFHEVLAQEEGEEFLSPQEVRRRKFTKADSLRYAAESAAYLKRLTPQEHNLLTYWTGGGSTVGATAVFGIANPWGFQTDDPTEEGYFDKKRYMATIDSALDKAELPAPKVLYRGLHNSAFQHAKGSIERLLNEESYAVEDGDPTPVLDKWLEENYTVGEEVTLPMPASSSESPSRAIGFSGGHILYEVKAHKAAPVGATSAWGLSEREYILPRTTKYRVVGVEKGVPYYYENCNKVTPATIIQLEQL